MFSFLWRSDFECKWSPIEALDACSEGLARCRRRLHEATASCLAALNLRRIASSQSATARRLTVTDLFLLESPLIFSFSSQPASWGVSLVDFRVAVCHKGEVIVHLVDGKKTLVFPHSRADSDMWMDLLQRASGRKIGNFNGVTGLIGMGSFAEVRIVYGKASEDQVAIKVMKKTSATRSSCAP
jgi:hypothetical protein